VHAYRREPGPPATAELNVTREGVARSWATGWLRDALEGFPAPWQPRLVVTEGDPAPALRRCSRRAAMLVLGQRADRRSGDASSVAARCEEEAACPVVLVPEGTPLAAESAVRDSEHDVVGS